jgi:hypothetical protein
MRRINQRRVKGPTNFTMHHSAYIALWNVRVTNAQYYLHGTRHRTGPWKEYLRWLHLQARLFLRPAYTEADIAELPDFDGNNEILDEYDAMTRHGTVQLECGLFQNYGVNIFPYLYCVRFLTLKFLIVTTVV